MKKWSTLCNHNRGAPCGNTPKLVKQGVKDLVLQKGRCLNQVRRPHKFQGISDLENVYIIRPVLRSAFQLLGVIMRTTPPELQHELLQVIAHAWHTCG